MVIGFVCQLVGVTEAAGCASRILTRHVRGIIAGAVGAILFATAGLAGGLAVTDIGTTVLVGTGAFFFAITLAALLCFSLDVAEIF